MKTTAIFIICLLAVSGAQAGIIDDFIQAWENAFLQVTLPSESYLAKGTVANIQVGVETHLLGEPIEKTTVKYGYAWYDYEKFMGDQTFSNWVATLNGVDEQSSSLFGLFGAQAVFEQSPANIPATSLVDSCVSIQNCLFAENTMRNPPFAQENVLIPAKTESLSVPNTGMKHLILVGYACYIETEWRDHIICDANFKEVWLYDCGSCSEPERCLVSHINPEDKLTFFNRNADESICRNELTGCLETEDCDSLTRAVREEGMKQDGNKLDGFAHGAHCEFDDPEDDVLDWINENTYSGGKIGECQGGAEKWQDCVALFGPSSEYRWLDIYENFHGSGPWAVTADGRCILSECSDSGGCIDQVHTNPDDWECKKIDVSDISTKSSWAGVCEYTQMGTSECSTDSDCLFTCNNGNPFCNTIVTWQGEKGVCDCTERGIPVSHCTDGIKNDDEEGLDCGGEDCESCTSHIYPWHCTDGKKNFGEDAMDCNFAGYPCARCGRVIGGGADGSDFNYTIFAILGGLVVVVLLVLIALLAVTKKPPSSSLGEV